MGGHTMSKRKKMNNRLREDAYSGKVTQKAMRFVPMTCSNVTQPRTILVSLPRLRFMELPIRK